MNTFLLLFSWPSKLCHIFAVGAWTTVISRTPCTFHAPSFPWFYRLFTCRMVKLKKKIHIYSEPGVALSWQVLPVHPIGEVLVPVWHGVHVHVAVGGCGEGLILIWWGMTVWVAGFFLISFLYFFTVCWAAYSFKWMYMYIVCIIFCVSVTLSKY